MADTSFAENDKILQAVKVLEELEKAGTIRPAEQAALDKYRAKTSGAKAVEADTIARYRGFASGLTANLKDEAAGLLDAMRPDAPAGQVVDGPNGLDLQLTEAPQGFASEYTATRDAVRNKDLAAQVLAPDAYSSGQLAGGIAGAAVPVGGIMKATAGMPMWAKSAYGGLTGGILGGLPAFGEGEGLTDSLMRARVPAAVGAGIGLLAPVAGGIAGTAVRGVQNAMRNVPGYGAKSTQIMARAMGKSQNAGTDIQQYLAALGPEGMIADIPGNPRRVAQGLAAMPGEGGELLGTAINQRALGASDRIKAEADAAIGAPNAAFQQRAALAQERASTLGPEYDAALAVQEPVFVGDIADTIASRQGDAVSRVSSTLKSLQSELGITTQKAGTAAKAQLPAGFRVVDNGDGTETVFAPVSATKLHNIRSELSDDLEEARRAGRGKFIAQMEPVLAKIDERLDQLPGYADARTGYANNKAMERAVDDGRAVFRGGESSAMSPDQLRAMVKNYSPAQLDAFRKGAREYIDALMGTARNDAAAAWQAFGKDWNEEKLRIILGKPEADKLINRLKAENIFSETRGDVLKGSQTEMRASAREELADLRDPETGMQPGPITRLNRAVGGAANSVIDGILYGPLRSKANREVGQILAMQGAERDRLLPLLLAEAQAQNVPTRLQRATTGLLDFGLRASTPALQPMITGNQR